MKRIPRTSANRRSLSSSIVTAVGALLVVSSLALYQLSLNLQGVISETDLGFLENIAYASLGLILVGIAMALFGATSLLRIISDQRSLLQRTSSLSRISLILTDRRSVKVLVAAAISYAVLFTIISSELVFQPGSNFSDVYGIKVPSIVPVVCCGTFGQMPQFVIYVTQQVAFLIIPLDLILVSAVSWLVGINAASVSFLYKYRSGPQGPKWFSGLGAIVGLFTACPTCAGFFFLSLLGVSSAATVSLALGSLQGLFALVGVPLLVLAFFLSVRQIGVSCDMTRQGVNNGLGSKGRKKMGFLG